MPPSPTAAVAATVSDVAPWPAQRLRQRRGPLSATLWPHGALATLRHDDLVLNLFPATALEAGLGNVWLRRRLGDGRWQPVALLGPAAPGRLHRSMAEPGDAPRLWQAGHWAPAAGCAIDYRVELVLADTAPAWFWHVTLCNVGSAPQDLDLVLVQDTGLAPWAALRLNEAYTSHYLDQQPLADARHGWLLATRQNQPVAGRHPWLLSGSLGQAVGWASDGLQLAGRAWRAGDRDGLLDQDLPSRRLQHEHALAALQDAVLRLEPGEQARRGFFGLFDADHPEASGDHDLARLAAVHALPEARPPAEPPMAHAVAPDPRTLFATAAGWPARAPDDALLQVLADDPAADGWRHVERDTQGRLLGAFGNGALHVVGRDHELAVLRPHGHLLRSGSHWTPDERALASTAWMAGVFHSSLTQGHASANRLLSTQRGHLGLYRGLGLRVFADHGEGWRLLALPSLFAMRPSDATWLYDDGGRLIAVQAAADAAPNGMQLSVQTWRGASPRLLLALHLPLNAADASDDGWGRFGDGSAAAEGSLRWQLAGQSEPGGTLWLAPSPGSAFAERFPGGGLALTVDAGAATWQVQGDEALFADGASRDQPWLCLTVEPTALLTLGIEAWLVEDDAMPGIDDPGAPRRAPLAGPQQPQVPVFRLPATAAAAAPPDGLVALADWLPWLGRDALVHYLTPRGLEQFSGGGWGTRDVCQGPAELLLALGRHDALRDLLCRVFSAQNPDGDWPQWFMFHPRDAAVRAGDSHGDIVFWPLAALADYLLASGDGALLDQPLPFHGEAAAWPLRAHVQRALAVVRRRTVAGTALAAYGHGDWNDALQPADPALRDHLCSAWTVTLHHRTLTALAAAWRALGLAGEAAAFSRWADDVLADFQRLLLPEGVLAGYALFDAEGEPGRVAEWLLHPRDRRTGIAYSALAMVHAVIDGLFTPDQAASHVALIARHLTGPDGLRLFDRPLRYHGGTMTLFQRGESAAYFGREIGLMYMHAHLRWAEALAQLGDADAFWRALRLANPIGLQALVPQAAPRQRNCYYSSSDAAFADRDEAWRHYGRVAGGDVALEGGWRLYSSGAGIAWRLVTQRLLGLQQCHDRLGLDPVMPAAFDGLEVELPLYGHAVTVAYRIGPRGHGQVSATLDGQALPLTTGHNPYRAPGAWLDAALFRARLTAGARRLELAFGHDGAPAAP